MIFGIGTDVVQISRIENAMSRFGERFPSRILMAVELEAYGQAKQKIRFLAMRFAAKEAIVKAMGTGFRHGVWLRDVGVAPDERGKPEIRYSARGSALCDTLGVGEGYLTLSDEAGLAVAFAVLMRSE